MHMSSHGLIVTCYFSLLGMFLKPWLHNSFVIGAIIWVFGHVLETLSSKLLGYCSLFNSFGLLGVFEVMFQHSTCALEIYVGHFKYWLCFLCSYVFVSGNLNFHLCSWSPCRPFFAYFPCFWIVYNLLFISTIIIMLSSSVGPNDDHMYSPYLFIKR